MIQVKEYPLVGPKTQELTQKFNEVFSNHTGYVPRSPNLWIELYLHNPEAHLLVAEEGQTLGYVIVTLQQFRGGKVAAVSEFCVWGKQEVLKALLDQVEIYARKMNADAIVSWDTDDEKANEVFEKQGFVPLGKGVFSVGLTSLDFLKSVLESSEKLLTKENSNHEINITVDLSGKKLPSYSGFFTIKISSNGEISVIEGGCSSPYACVKTDIVTFTEIILGIRNPYKALMLREVNITPLWKTIKTVNLLKLLSRRLKWHIPLGDYF